MPRKETLSSPLRMSTNDSEAMKEIISDLDLRSVSDDMLDGIGGHSSSESANLASPTSQSASSLSLLDRNTDTLLELEISAANSPSSQSSRVLTPTSAGSSR